MIWRGPMVMSALTQMLREVQWGELDVLVVDMPPGTGDAQLTMAQQVPLAGAVIVSTPQDLALIDARKGLNMFKKVDVPLLGIVENMSCFLAPDTGKRYDIFGHGGARREAERLGRDLPRRGAAPDGNPRDLGCRANRWWCPSRTGPRRKSIAPSPARSGNGSARNAPGRKAPRRPSSSNRRQKRQGRAYRPVERREELPGELLRRRLDQPAAELGDLAADIGLGGVFEHASCSGRPRPASRPRRPWRSRRLRPCPRPGYRVAARRFQIGQRHRAGESRLDRPDLQHDGGSELVVGGFLQATGSPECIASAPPGSLSASHTFWIGASMRSSPSIFKAMGTSRLRIPER